METGVPSQISSGCHYGMLYETRSILHFALNHRVILSAEKLDRVADSEVAANALHCSSIGPSPIIRRRASGTAFRDFCESRDRDVWRFFSVNLPTAINSGGCSGIAPRNGHRQLRMDCSELSLLVPDSISLRCIARDTAMMADATPNIRWISFTMLLNTEFTLASYPW